MVVWDIRVERAPPASTVVRSLCLRFCQLSGMPSYDSRYHKWAEVTVFWVLIY